jgi:hypothetical protein
MNQLHYGGAGCDQACLLFFVDFTYFVVDSGRLVCIACCLFWLYQSDYAAQESSEMGATYLAVCEYKWCYRLFDD